MLSLHKTSGIGGGATGGHVELELVELELLVLVLVLVLDVVVAVVVVDVVLVVLVVVVVVVGQGKPLGGIIKKSGSTVVELAVVVVVVKSMYGLALLKHGGLGWPTNYLHYL